MTRLGEPLELPLSRAPDQAAIPIELVRRQLSPGAAFCLAYQVGCTLTMIKSVAERQRDEAEHRAREAEAQVALLKSLLVGRVAA